MSLPILFALAIAAGQSAATPVDAVPGSRGPGRFFVSPMGEPFYGRTAGEDGLIVWFEQADANHDGSITSDEMAADASRFFAILDRQKDGEIDPDDINYYEAVIAPQLRAQSIITVTSSAGGDTSEQVDDESASGRFGLLKIPQPVASADRNFNRGVSPEEFRSAAQRRFQLLDTQGKGSVTLPELQRLRQAAAVVAKRRPVNPGETHDPTDAEYGRRNR